MKKNPEKSKNSQRPSVTSFNVNYGAENTNKGTSRIKLLESKRSSSNNRDSLKRSASNPENIYFLKLPG